MQTAYVSFPACEFAKLAFSSPYVVDRQNLMDMVSFIAKDKSGATLVYGPTAVGKTTVLNGLLDEISKTEKGFCVETLRELQPQGKNLKFLTLTEGDYFLGQDKKEITHSDYAFLKICQSFPDYIVFGEITRSFAPCFVQACMLNKPILATCHAATPSGVLKGIEENVMLSDTELAIDPSKVKSVLADSVQFFIGVEKNSETKEYDLKISGLVKNPETQELSFPVLKGMKDLLEYKNLRQTQKEKVLQSIEAEQFLRFWSLRTMVNSSISNNL